MIAIAGINRTLPVGNLLATLHFDRPIGRTEVARNSD